MNDEGYFNALDRMYGQALSITSTLPTAKKTIKLQRLDAVRTAFAGVGWGVKDAMDELWLEHVNDAGPERTFAVVRQVRGKFDARYPIDFCERRRLQPIASAL